MKKSFISLALAASLLTLASCSTVNYINTETLKENYEKKIHYTTLPGKVLFKFDRRKMDTYQNVQVFMNENEVNHPFEVVAYGSYTPIVLPLIRSERPRLEKYLLWKAARKARKLKANGVIIDNKNNFRVINLK